MASSAQSYFAQFYKTASSYAPTVQTQNALKAFVWNNKDLIVVGTVVGLVIWKIVHYVRNMPQMPDVDMKCSMTNAVLTIKIPKADYTPPNVTLTFCVDTSSSMNPDRLGAEDRAGEVKQALSDLLDNAQQVVTRSAEAKISIAITAFAVESRIITPPTTLTAANGESKKVKGQVDALESNGSTNILNGLAGAVEELKKIVMKNPQASHYVVLLTDGEDPSYDNKRLIALQKSIALTSAKLFAVGIGKKHSGIILNQIATGNGFKGVYIDTTKNSIKDTIAAIYNQAISSFQELELSSSLPVGTWSIDSSPSVANKEQSKVSLGALEEGKTMTKQIVIHGHKFKADLDLSTVFFNLTFKDPKGREGVKKLHWKYSPIVIPTIEEACRRYRQ